MSVQIYDDFAAPGYALADYHRKWMTPNGVGEMGVRDTREFTGGSFTLSAVPFQTGFDVGVDDHRKYLAVSTHAFPVPSVGTLVLSSDIKASTPGTVPGLTQLGVYGPPGSWQDPVAPPRAPEYSAARLEGQQAAVVMNVIDFCTGQLFDWFITSDTAFALIERLPTIVTGNVGNPDCRGATEVGVAEMYTQIIREIPVQPDEWHHVDIALTRHDDEAWVDYFLDHQPFAHVEKIGIPLDKQGVPFTGMYPSIGDGEPVGDKLDSVRFGHGLFSLLDAFPFQHPAASDLSVSIPVGDPSDSGSAGRTRLFGQGARGSFRNFTTLAISGPASASEIASALAGAHA